MSLSFSLLSLVSLSSLSLYSFTRSLSLFLSLSLSLILTLSSSLPLSPSPSLSLFVCVRAIGEMCAVLYCGFPSLGDTMAAYPALLPHDQKANIRGVKVVDFHKHLRFVLFLHTATSIGLFKLEQKYVFLERKEWLRYRFLN